VTSHSELLVAAGPLSDWINEVASEVTRFSDEIAVLLTRNLGGREEVGREALQGLEGLSRSFLSDHPFVAGAGAIFSSDVIEQRQGVLEWWTRTPNGGSEKLVIDLTPGGERFYDYEKLPFFSTAATTGKQTMWGPYLDYLGADDYVLTHSAPFFVDGRFMGVAGCDLRVQELETVLMPILLRIPGHAALLNASGRVIIGNSGRYLVGERVKPDAAGKARVELAVPHLGLSLLCT
jgi:hypothetical protein